MTDTAADENKTRKNVQDDTGAGLSSDNPKPGGSPKPDRAVRFQKVPVERVAPGSTVKTPQGAAVEILSIRWESDDYGNDAVAILGYGKDQQIRIAAGAGVHLSGRSVPQSQPSTPPLPLIPAEAGTAEAVVARTAAAHGGHETIQRLAARLAKGLNLKSGANLQDVRDLAQVLFVELSDEANAVTVSELITGLPFDGNPGRWTPVEQCLALTHYMARLHGNTAEAERLAGLLRAPDRAETDPFRAKISAVVRQRSLNEPNLYDKEISRTAAAGDRRTELEWRALRLNTLLHLLAHGGSETFDDAELERRISNELTEIRANHPG
ncbi:hypothetical protein IV498_06490 [Paenarthrobacter sp. Z7-10]|uniref:DUF6707 family protein n=1 Tax=Paenarthrobacter sp. Z7-10 TaxID=2787635 RepID=UPI0022A9D052|nr:DUF6707 family protein [Paenarthrobacter sp. Z7-10]MCZ2402840.1 hypothetical protein [Paenarthrobacter sp. Z7-10]